MKPLLIATAALSLIGGAAFAQSATAPQSMGDPTPTNAPGNMTPNTSPSPPSRYTPQTTYPVGTSKHEDRCVNRSQAMRVASIRSRKARSTSSSMASETQPSGL